MEIKTGTYRDFECMPEAREAELFEDLAHLCWMILNLIKKL